MNCVSAKSKRKSPRREKAGALPVKERASLLSAVRHAAVLRRSRLLVFRNIGDKGLSGQHERCDRSGVLQSGAGDLGRVNDAGFYQVLELIALGVVAKVRVFCFANLA